MAYEVTATRRRPQRFEDVIGQEFVVATLKNAIETGKIAHAYLFSGPRGCGKTSSARILAKALNCERGPVAEPCGVCTACQEITKGASLDVIEIDGASNTSVNDIRQIKDEVLFPPNSCRYKIYIIDEVHMLSTSAFNALLKTIEEPPPYVIFIFATTELHKVPATIKSRCQQFNFRLVAPEQVKKLLADTASEMGIKADDEALYWIARESTGSIRDAYTLFDQVAAFSGDHITFEKIRDKLGLVGVDSLNEICELCVAGDSAAVLLKLDGILQNGVSIEQFIVNCTDYFRNLLLIKSHIQKESLLGQSESRFSAKVLESWNSIQIERALSLFLQLFRDIRYSLSPRTELELAVSRLTWLSSYISPAEVKSAVDKAGHLLLSGAHQTPSASAVRQEWGTGAPFRGSGYGASEPVVAAENDFQVQDNPFEQMKRNLQRMTSSVPVPAAVPPEEKIVPENPDPVYFPHEAPVQNSAYGDLNLPQNISAYNGQNVPADSVQGLDSQNPSAMSVSASSFYPQNNQNQSAADGSSSYPFRPQYTAVQNAADTNFTAVPAAASSGLQGDALKRELTEQISAEKSLVGAAMAQAQWQISDREIILIAETPFVKNQIEAESNYICKLLAKLHGSPVKFTVNLKPENENPQTVRRTFSQVDLLCSVFKGTEIPQIQKNRSFE